MNNKNNIDCTFGTEKNESEKYNLDIAENSWQNILVFYDAWCVGLHEHTQEGLDILKLNVNNLEECLKRCKDIPEQKLEMYQLAVENGKDILKYSTILEYHVFE